MQTVISTENLTLNYGSRRGIADVSLRIGQGEIFGFLGPNGAGKSTTIRVLLGFLRAGKGAARVFGQDVWTKSHLIKADVGYVPGDVRLYSWLTLRRALQIAEGVRGVDLITHGMQLAQRFRLEPDLSVRKMSRGNRQKVALIMALVHRPKLVILDEPTSGLDPLMQDELAEQLRQLSSMGHTVFFSSHTLSEVEALCTRVAVVRDGRIVSDQLLQDMKARAPRAVSIDLHDTQNAAEIDWPDYLTLLGQHASRLSFRMTGTAEQFVGWAATQGFRDLSIGQPSLEVMFRSFYESSSGGDS